MDSRNTRVVLCLAIAFLIVVQLVVPPGTTHGANPLKATIPRAGDGNDPVAFLPLVRGTYQAVPPQISNLQLVHPVLPVPRAGEQYNQGVALMYQDPDLDLRQIRWTFTGPDGVPETREEAFASSYITGTFFYEWVVESSFAAGSYEVGVELLDARGYSSGVQTATYELQSTAARPLEVTGFSPTSGGPGDVVTLAGAGFVAGDPAANRVTFGAGLSEAPILAMTSTAMTVTVPEGATSGPIVVENPVGRASSAAWRPRRFRRRKPRNRLPPGASKVRFEEAGRRST